MGRWQCRGTRIRCSGATSRWCPSGLAAGVCGLSADLAHGCKALCVAGRRCIENIELTCAMLRGGDHASAWWPPAPWDTYEVQRIANLWLCGWAPRCKCSGGNATSVSGAWWVQGHSPDHRYTLPPPPPTQGARQPGWGERRAAGEHPGERVGARGRGRGRARGWHTRVTARRRQGGHTYRQGRQREGGSEGRQATEGRRARGSSKTRAQNQNKKKPEAGQADTQEGYKEEAGRGRWGEQGANEGAKKHNVSQRSTMPLTCIEPYRQPRPTIRELMERRLAGEDDGGVPPKGCLGRPPRSAYRSEDTAEALRRVRAREIQPWRGDHQ